MHLLQAQTKSVLLKGEATLQISELVSLQEQKEQLKELAIKNALESHFGSTIEEISVQRIHSINDESISSYDRLLEVKARGLLERVISVEYIDRSKEMSIGKSKINVKLLTCRVKIHAIAEEDPLLSANLSVCTLNCPKLLCQTDEFMNEEGIFLYLKSPMNGYVAVFLEGERQVDCLLSASGQSMGNKGFPVSKEQDYIFFTEQSLDTAFVTPKTDSYEVTTDRPVEINRMYILFSEEKIPLPGLSRDYSRLSEKELLLGYSVPRSMSSQEFYKWIMKFLKSRRNSKKDLKRINIVIRN